MNKAQIFIKRHGTTLALCALLVASLGGGYFLIQQKNATLETMKAELQKGTEQITALTNDIGTLKTEAEMAKKELEEFKAQHQNQSEDLAAFAKQAAACEDIKKKLNVKK
jgi:prefoldin subunit 5